MKKLFVTPVILVGLTGCGSTPKAEKPPVAESTVISKKFTEGLKSTSVTPNQGCPKLKDSDAKLAWKELVDMANRCVSAAAWPEVEKIGHWLSENEMDAPWGAFYLSHVALQRKEYATALWLTDLALRKAPGMALGIYQKARIKWARGENGPAIQLMKEALRVDPELTDAHYFLAQVEFRDQEFKSAALHFSKVLESRPNDLISLSGLAECHIQNANPKGAAEVLARAIIAHPKKVDFYVRQGFVFDEILKDELQTEVVYKKLRDAKKSGGLDGAVPEQIEVRLKELEKKNAQGRAVAGIEKKNPVVTKQDGTQASKGGTQ